MAIKARTTVTLTQYRDTQSVTRYYKLRPAGSSAPLKPETKPPSSDWTDSEPACDISKELYFCDLTIFSNGEWEYSTVSKSTSYEAAKQAYNRADDAQKSIDNLEVGGRNLFLNTGETVSNNNYKISEYAPASEALKAGEIYTATICVTPAEHVSKIGLYFSLGYVNPASFLISGTSKQIISSKFTMAYYDGKTPDVHPSYAYAQLYRFPEDGTVTGNTTIHWCKIEKGNKATDWTPAPEDVDEEIKNAATTATNYIHSDDTNGLVVNNNQTVGVGYDVQLKANGSDTGMNIRQDGNILASFLQNSVSLGKNSINSKVAMCGDKGGVSASFGYYIDSVTSNNAEPGSTLSFDFNETTFKNKVGQKTGFYEFTYTSAAGWELFDPVNDSSYAVTLSQYGITMKTPTSSIKDHAGITINYVLDGSVKFYNADISNPVRKLELEMAENPSSSESDFANITIERQSGTYANGDGKEHSIITMMTLHEFANVATLSLFDDSISLDATHLYLTSSYGEGAINLHGNTHVVGDIISLNGPIRSGLDDEPLIKYQTLTASYTISANSYKTVTFSSSALHPTGYENYHVIGIARISTGHLNVCKISGWYVSYKGDCSVTITNHGNSSAIKSTTLTVNFIYAHDNLF